MQGLRRLVESWLGLPATAPGEDTRWQWQLALGWPDWLLTLFWLGAVFVVVGIYWREGRSLAWRSKLALAGLRLSLVLLVLLMIGKLQLMIERTGLPYLVFLVDDSESMQVADQPVAPTTGSAPTPAPKPRFQQVFDWLSQEQMSRLQRLTNRYKVQFYLTSTSLRLQGTATNAADVQNILHDWQQVQPTGTQSRLGNDLRELLNSMRGTPPAAVVLLTDGQVTEEESLTRAAQVAARKQIPLFPIGVGSAAQTQEVELKDLLVDETVFINDVVRFEAKMVGQGLTDQTNATETAGNAQRSASTTPGSELRVELYWEPVAEESNRTTAPVPIADRGTPTVPPVDQITVPVTALTSGQPLPIRLSHRPTQAGVWRATLITPFLPREVQRDNNRIERLVRVIDEPIRVLYVESRPRWEFQYLKSVLERETTVALNVVLLDSDLEYASEDRSALIALPTTREELFRYDVILFGDVDPRRFLRTQLENLREFVQKKGGGYLWLAGERAVPALVPDTPLAELLPVAVVPEPDLASHQIRPFQVQLTLEGQMNPIFRFAPDEQQNKSIWQNLPALYWYATAVTAKPGAQILAVHPSARVPAIQASSASAAQELIPCPLAATQFVGAGRVFYQGFDESWRWRYRVEDLYHARYWVQLVRYLARTKLLGNRSPVELFVDRPIYRRGEPVQIRLRFLEEAQIPNEQEEVVVAIQSADQPRQTLRLQRVPGSARIFEGIFLQTFDGRYEINLQQPTITPAPAVVFFEVLPPPGERDRVQMNESELQHIAKLTHGKYLPLDAADELFAHLPLGQRVSLQTDPPIPVWRSWPMLLLFVGMIASEWIIRKRYRLT